MYKLRLDRDGITPIMFLDALMFIPGSDENAAYINEAMRETFVIRFNKHYSSIAYKKAIKFGPESIEMILVPTLYEETKMGEDPKIPREITKQEAIDMVKPVLDDWQKYFGLPKNGHTAKLFADMLKKDFIVK